MVQRFKDTPEKDRVPVNEQEKIMHVALPIGDNILMGTDALESMGHTLTSGNTISLSIEATDTTEAGTLFNSLSVGGKIDMPLADMFCGAYFGMLTDTYGIKWMINCTHKK